MDKKTYTIGILSITALILFLAQFIPLHPATAAEAVQHRDFSLVTARTVAGGEALYIADGRTQLMAVFTWDPGRRQVVLRDVKPITDAFNQ